MLDLSPRPGPLVPVAIDRHEPAGHIPVEILRTELGAAEPEPELDALGFRRQRTALRPVGDGPEAQARRPEGQPARARRFADLGRSVEGRFVVAEHARHAELVEGDAGRGRQRRSAGPRTPARRPL